MIKVQMEGPCQLPLKKETIHMQCSGHNITDDVQSFIVCVSEMNTVAVIKANAHCDVQIVNKEEFSFQWPHPDSLSVSLLNNCLILNNLSILKNERDVRIPSQLNGVISLSEKQLKKL